MTTIGFNNKGGQIIELNVNELTNLLKSKEKGTWCFMETETKVRMNKTGNPFFDKVTKKTYWNVLMGNSYKDRVEKETGITEFTPEKNNVGGHVSKCVLHNDKTGKDYLQFENFDYKSIPNYPKQFIPKNPEYTYEGNIIDKMLFESYMIQSTPNKYGVTFLSVTISNIKRIHMDGNEYIVVSSPVISTVGEVSVPTEV